MRKDQFEIIITKHAFDRALQRGIYPDLIEDTFLTGKMKRFGRNRTKFEKRFKKFTVVCVDEIIGDIIKIVTIEKKRR